ARVSEQQLEAFSQLQQRGDLTLRFQAAREITPDETPDVASVASAVDKAVAFAKKWHQADWTPAPGIGLNNIK
ncbi:hypothetical protein CGH97_26050, partial [Vibrio parahaemolyticus]